MFEARLLQGALLKKIIEALRELVVDVNLDCDETGLKLQVIYIHYMFNMKYEIEL